MSSIEGSIIAYELLDDYFHLLMSDEEEFKTYKATCIKLATFLECASEEVEDTLQLRMPFPCKLQVKDNLIESISN
jgi:hypothetical protein